MIRFREGRHSAEFNENEYPKKFWNIARELFGKSTARHAKWTASNSLRKWEESKGIKKNRGESKEIKRKSPELLGKTHHETTETQACWETWPCAQWSTDFVRSDCVNSNIVKGPNQLKQGSTALCGENLPKSFRRNDQTIEWNLIIFLPQTSVLKGGIIRIQNFYENVRSKSLDRSA